MGELVYHTKQFRCCAWVKFEGKSKMSGDERADKQRVNAGGQQLPSVLPEAPNSPTSHPSAPDTHQHSAVFEEHQSSEKLGAFLGGLIPVQRRVSH